MAGRRRALEESDYQRLARFRYALRRFLRFSEAAARRAGVSPAQYELLLFVRSFGSKAPIVAELAELLQIRHQSAVGLLDRCAKAGLARRESDGHDRRRVRVRLTAAGRRRLARLVLQHYRAVDELRRAVPRPASIQVPIPNKEGQNG